MANTHDEKETIHSARGGGGEEEEVLWNRIELANNTCYRNITDRCRSWGWIGPWLKEEELEQVRHGRIVPKYGY